MEGSGFHLGSSFTTSFAGSGFLKLLFSLVPPCFPRKKAERMWNRHVWALLRNFGRRALAGPRHQLYRPKAMVSLGLLAPNFQFFLQKDANGPVFGQFLGTCSQ
ncbi:MAG: hypothetical protein DWQ01_15460 [Planctomycetota bacterium]|nr:MAG: hypothetical protein DWQ01_15460 [Planctomycetota bacterium]